MRFIIVFLLFSQLRLSCCGKFYEMVFLCERVSEATLESKLLGNFTLSSEITCSLKCGNKGGCDSALVDIARQRCLLLSGILTTVKRCCTETKDERTKMIYIHERKPPCGIEGCKNGGLCYAVNETFSCKCQRGWTGGHCEVKVTVNSCLDIRTKFRDMELKSGIYKLQWNETSTFDAYCEMQRDGGGWTRVFHVVANATKAQDVTFKTTDSIKRAGPRGNYYLSTLGLRALKDRIGFTEFFFYCKNNLENRVISFKSNKTATNVLLFLIGEGNDRPTACGTYYRFEDDNSYLTKNCTAVEDGKWGLKNVITTYIDHPLYIDSQRHFLLMGALGRNECDNFQPASIDPQDKWEVYVR